MAGMELYDELKTTELDLGDLSAQWKKIAPTINRLPGSMMTTIYALILHHSHLESKGKKSGVPYGGKTFDTGRGLLYVADSLPVALQEIIIKYVLTAVDFPNV